MFTNGQENRTEESDVIIPLIYICVCVFLRRRKRQGNKRSEFLRKTRH